MKIGIFGGTFNPFHKGHLKIIIESKKEFNFDLIYIIPTFITPNKSFLIEQISAKKRYKMIKTVIKAERLRRVKVSKIEIKRKNTSYTFDTLKHLQKKHPKDNFYLILGEDNYVNFENWYKWEEILKIAQLIIFRRNLNSKIELRKNNIIFYEKILDNISSKKILSNLQLNKIHPKTLKYISKHKLYLKSFAYYNLSTARFNHSLSVAHYSKRLAKRNFFLNTNNAFYAGLLHDFFKEKSDNYQVNYFNKFGGDFYPPISALHGFNAALWLKYEYGLKNKKIINAIQHHTIPIKKMKKLDKIVYVADKISADRKYLKVSFFRKNAMKNLDLTFKELFFEQFNYLQSKNINIDYSTRKAYNYYLSKEGKQRKKTKANKKYERIFKKI